MSALAEALVAAQRRAVAVLEKAYVAGAFEEDRMREQLDAIGLSDAVDQDQLIQALATIRAYGGPLPAAARGNGDAVRKASPSQVAYIQDLLRKSEQTPLAEQDLRNMTHEKASDLISTLKAGTYDSTAWDVPI